MEDMQDGEGTPVPFITNREVAYDSAVKSVEQVMVLPVFAHEKLTPELVGELAPMLQCHYDEVAHFKDIPLDPDWLQYFQMQDDDRLRIFTARDAGRIVGYNAFFIGNHIHYKTFRVASNDVIFVNRMERGFGAHWRAYCEAQLEAEGLKMKSYHVKVAHAHWEKSLAREGYEHVENIWAKRLGK